MNSHSILSIGILAVSQHNSQKKYLYILCSLLLCFSLMVFVGAAVAFFRCCFIPFVSHTTFCFMLKFHGAIVRMASTHTSHHSKFITKALFIVYTVVYVVFVVAVVVFRPHYSLTSGIDSPKCTFRYSHIQMCVLDCAQQLPQPDKPLSMCACPSCVEHVCGCDSFVWNFNWCSIVATWHSLGHLMLNAAIFYFKIADFHWNFEIF